MKPGKLYRTKTEIAFDIQNIGTFVPTNSIILLLKIEKQRDIPRYIGFHCEKLDVLYKDKILTRIVKYGLFEWWVEEVFL